VFTIKPDAALAELGRVLQGVLLLFHRAHPLRVLLSGKPGAVQQSTSKALSIGLEKPGRLRKKSGLKEHLGRHKYATGPIEPEAPSIIYQNA
jgi:hypothetical protein